MKIIPLTLMFKIESILILTTNFLIALNATVARMMKPRNWIKSMKWKKIAWLLFTHKFQYDMG